MLGRYVAGTLLILGVAMIMAPSSPEIRRDSEPVEVTRAETTPTILTASKPVALPEPVVVAERQATATAAPADSVSAAGVEAAVLEAMNLDLAQGAEGSETDPEAPAGTEIVAATAEALAPDGFEQADAQHQGVLAGLGDPGFMAGNTGAAAGRPASGSPEVLFVTGNRVNVRSGPSTDYGVVGFVVQGEPVELVAYGNDGWAQIRINNGEQTGFMASQFLAQDPNGG